MFRGIIQRTKEKIKQFSWEVVLKKIENDLDISDPEKIKEFEGEMNKIKDSFDYYDEEKISPWVDQLLEEIGIEEDKKEQFREKIKNILKEYFRKSPEKKGINFRDKIEDPQEVRAWLYLVLPEEERKQFEGDFKKAITAKEPIYFRLWPPPIRNAFRYFIGKEEPVGYKPGEFQEDLTDYIEDIKEGKHRITLVFDENNLPENLKNKSENELKNLGIHKVDGEYEIYITPKEMQHILIELAGTPLERGLQEIEIGKQLMRIKELFKKCKFLTKTPEGNSLYLMYGSLIKAAEEQFRYIMEEGASEEELGKLKNTLDKIEKSLNEILGTYNKEKNKEFALKKAISKGWEWLKTGGQWVFLTLGLWGLLFAWFLPLWLIKKMDDQLKDYFK